MAAPPAEPPAAAPAAPRRRARAARRAAVPRAAGRPRPRHRARDGHLGEHGARPMSRRTGWPPHATRPSRPSRDLPTGGHVSVIAADRSARIVVNETTDLSRVRARRSTPSSHRRRAATSATRSSWHPSSRRGRATPRSSSPRTPPLATRRSRPRSARRSRCCRSAGTARTRRSSRSRSATAPSSVTRSVFVSVANLDIESAQRRLEVWGDDHLLEARDVALDAQARSDVVIDDIPQDVGVVEVRLVGADATVDGGPGPPRDRRPRLGGPPVGRDEARPARRRRATRISRPRSRTCRTSSSTASRPRSTARRRQRTDGRPWDLVIFESNLPATLPDAPILAIAPPRTSDLGEVTRHAQGPGDRRAEPGRADPPLRRPLDHAHLRGATTDDARLGPDRHPGARGRAAPLPGDAGGPADRGPGLRAAALGPAAAGGLPDPARQPDRRAAGRIGRADRGRRRPATRSTLVGPGGRDRRDGHPARRHRRRASWPRAAGGSSRHVRRHGPAGHLHRHPDPRPEASARPSGSGAGASVVASPAGTAAAPGASAGASGHPVDAAAPVRFAVDLFDVGESTIAPGSAAAIEALGTAPRRVPRPGWHRRARRAARRPATSCGCPIVLLVLIGLCVEWAVYHRDALIRIRRSIARAVRPPAVGRERLDGHLVRDPALAARAHPASWRSRSPCTWPRGGAWAPAGGASPSSCGRCSCSALVFAIAGFQLVLPVDRLATVFVVDLSDSVGNAGREDALAFLRETLKEKPTGDVAGIVAFGKEALVERLPSEVEEIERHRLGAGPAPRPTSAPRCAWRPRSSPTTPRSGSCCCQRRQRHDRQRPGRGGPRREPRRADRDPADRARRRRRGPRRAPDDAVDRSTSASPSRPWRTSGRRWRSRRRSGCSPTAAWSPRSRSSSPPARRGSRFDIKPTEAGFHTFRAVVEAARDTFSQNDRADSNTIVKGEPRTLVLAGDDAVADRADRRPQEPAAARRQARARRRCRPTSPGLATYDSIVLVDVPRIRLSDRQLAALQVYVRDLGKGLVMVGGPESFGAGGYQKTPLEESLPVDMGVRDRQKQPDIALVVVIDKSGSMAACHCNTFDRGTAARASRGVQKVDIGKEAILRAAAAMTERDELGVVAFNEAAHWVVKTQPLGNIADLQGQHRGHPGRRPDEHLLGPRPGRPVARGRDRDAPPHHPADRRLVDLRAVRRRSSRR